MTLSFRTMHKKEVEHMKLMKWLLKISLTAVLVSTLTILTTGIVVNAYLQSVLASFNIQLEGQPMGVGGIMKNILGMNGSSVDKAEDNVEEDSTQNGATPDSSGSTDDTSGSKDVNGQGSSNTGERGSTDESGGNSEAVDGESPPEDSLPVMGQIGQSAADQQVVMTPDEMVDKKSSLTAQEKEEIFTLLMTKLPQEEMQKISEAMEDGLTAAELDEIQNGISKYLSEEEFQKLMTMLQK